MCTKMGLYFLFGYMSYDKQLIYIEQLLVLQNRRLIIETVARSESLQNLLWLNISELSVIKNVTANYLETSYILFFHNFAIYKERFDYRYKDKSNF